MSDEFVHLENTEQPKSDKVDQTASDKADQTASDKVDQTESNKEQTEELSKFFTSILSQDGEIKENNNIISNLLGGILRNLIKNNLDEKEQSGSENDDNENESDDNENDENGIENDDKDKQSEAESDDSDNYTEMFIILENKKSYNYATSYPRARRTLLARFHRFLENNSSTYMRIEKESERIVVYERQPNTLSPYDEQLLYQIEFFSVEKYVDC